MLRASGYQPLRQCAAHMMHWQPVRLCDSWLVLGYVEILTANVRLLSAPPPLQLSNGVTQEIQSNNRA
jgi:hypothetical protein